MAGSKHRGRKPEPPILTIMVGLLTIMIILTLGAVMALRGG